MKLLKFLFRLFLATILVTLLYGAVALVLTLFPKTISTSSSPKDQTIYLYYNMMHSDIIINLKDSHINWDQLLPEIIKKPESGFIAFGWGDRETYLTTPPREDIPLSTAVKALFTNTPSILHIQYYPHLQPNHSNIKSIALTATQYQLLEQSLLKSFGKVPHFISMAYSYQDAFYHSNETYNLIHTCNTWTGDRLREAHITMSYWTPLSYNVLYALP